MQFGRVIQQEINPVVRRVGDTLGSRSALRFDADAVVHCSINPLLAAEITLVVCTETCPKELNLLQLSAGRMAQLRARAPQIMRSESNKAEFLSVMFHHMSHKSLRHAITPPLSQLGIRIETVFRSRALLQQSKRLLSI